VRPPDLAGIRARVLLIRGRYDRMVPVEVSIAILNHIADSRLVLLNGKRTAIAEHARSRFADQPQRFGRT
jgi:pimeloyl-ACP methyl ester carboxylesterase